MKRRTVRRRNPRSQPAKRAAPTKAARPKRVPRRFHAIGGVDPRELPAGALYPCDDPRIGTRTAGDTFAGTVLSCAVPPEGKRGRFFVVGGIESGASISSARSRRERTREALRARWEGPDLDARGTRRPRAKAPPPSSLAALPVPEAREMVLHRGDGAIARPGPTDRAREPVLYGEVIDLDARPQSRIMRDLRAAAERFMGREELVEEDLGALRRAEDALFERTGNVSFARLIVPPASPDASQRRRDAVDARRKSRVAQGIRLARNAKTLDAKIRASTQSRLADRVALALIALADAAPVGSFPGESPGVAPASLTVARPRRSPPRANSPSALDS